MSPFNFRLNPRIFHTWVPFHISVATETVRTSDVLHSAFFRISIVANVFIQLQFLLEVKTITHLLIYLLIN